MPLNVTAVSARVSGRGTPFAVTENAAKSIPKIVIIEPGATAPFGSSGERKLAAFTTLLGPKDGAAKLMDAAGTSTVAVMTGPEPPMSAMVMPVLDPS